MSARVRIIDNLTRAFAPAAIEVIDESHQHAGHAGHRPGGETHFRVYIVSEAFRGKDRLQRHRMVNETLSGELKGAVKLMLTIDGALEPDPADASKVRRKPGTTHITGTAESPYGTFAVDITR